NPNRRETLAELAGQSDVTAAAGHFESHAADIGAEENARVVIESANLAEIDRQVLRKLEPLEYRINFFEMIQRFDRTGIANQVARLLDHVLASGQVRNRPQNLFSAVCERKLRQQRFQAGLILFAPAFLQCCY